MGKSISEVAELAIIFWTDAAMHGTNQYSRKELEDYGLIDGISCGIIVSEDKKQITIAMDFFPADDQFRQASTYPKSGIRQIIRKKVEQK